MRIRNAQNNNAKNETIKRITKGSFQRNYSRCIILGCHELFYLNDTELFKRTESPGNRNKTRSKQSFGRLRESIT